MSQTDLFAMFCVVVVFVVLAACGLCAFAFKRASDSVEDAHASAHDAAQQTINTLDQLLRLTNDRCLNISDAHLEAKRDEREAAPSRRETRPVVIAGETAVEESDKVDWSADVGAVGTPGS